MCRRDGKSDRLGAARHFQRVDANHPAVAIDERAAAVARVDCGIGLNELHPAGVPDGADDPPGDGVLESERRPDREHLLTRAHATGPAKLEDLHLVRPCGGSHDREIDVG